MKCNKCGSENVNVQMVSETNIKQKARHGLLYWVCGGWIISLIMWFIFTIPMLFLAIFKPKKYKSTTKHRKMCVCQECGKSWNA